MDSGLLKYLDDERFKDGDPRGNVSFTMAAEDGMPFRGPLPLLKANELEKYSAVVSDAHVELLDLSDAAQRAKLQAIFDGVANGWYAIYERSHNWSTRPDGSVTLLYFVVWVAPYKEIDRRKMPTDLATSNWANQVSSSSAA